MGSHSPLVNWRNFFCHALGQGSLVLSSLRRCHVAEVGTASAGLGELGRGHLLHHTCAALLQAWVLDGPGSLYPTLEAISPQMSSGYLVVRRPLQPQPPKVLEDFRVKTWSFSLNFKPAHFLLQWE